MFSLFENPATVGSTSSGGPWLEFLNKFSESLEPIAPITETLGPLAALFAALAAWTVPARIHKKERQREAETSARKAQNYRALCGIESLQMRIALGRLSKAIEEALEGQEDDELANLTERKLFQHQKLMDLKLQVLSDFGEWPQHLYPVETRAILDALNFLSEVTLFKDSIRELVDGHISREAGESLLSMTEEAIAKFRLVSALTHHLSDHAYDQQFIDSIVKHFGSSSESLEEQLL